MIELGVVVAVVTLIVGAALAFGITRLGTIRLQVTALALVSVMLPIAAVAATGMVMFHMGADIEILAVSLVAAVAAVGCALVTARTIAQRIDSLRVGAARLADGSLGTRLELDGPSELAELAGSLNAMAANIEALFRTRRELVVAASHDLRSPLASLQAMLEATRDGVVDPDHYLEQMLERSFTLGRLIDELFELSALDAGAVKLEIEPIDVAHLVETARAVHQAAAERRSVGLVVADQADAGMVRCSHVAMERVFANVIDNALRYTPAGGTIEITALRHPEFVLLGIDDSGSGFADLARATEAFWRDDEARGSDHDGRAHAGLGLAIARGLMERQRGSLEVANRPGGGARVELQLPSA